MSSSIRDHQGVLAIRDAHRAAIMAMPGVVGSGVGVDGHGNHVIRIYLDHDAVKAAYETLIPAIGGAMVKWEVTGPIVASAWAVTP